MSARGSVRSTPASGEVVLHLATPKRDPEPLPDCDVLVTESTYGKRRHEKETVIDQIREEFDRTGDAVNSVADGLASTARVITAAAAIMVVVFGSFLLEDDRIVQLFGLGLATAILIDATLVRMLLVPATMELLGDRNWWLPRWLDRILPHLAGAFQALAMRVPTINVSAMRLTVNVKQETDTRTVNAILREATSGRLSGILGYKETPLVSCDFNHDPRSSIVDAPTTYVIDNMVKVLSWYDNEWGYSNRVVDILKTMADQG